MRAILLSVILLGDANARMGTLDPANCGLLRTIAPLGGDLAAIAFNPDGRRLAVGCRDTIRIYDTATWREAARLRGQPHLVQSVAFSPDGRKVAGGESEGTIEIWDIQTGRPEKRLKADSSNLSSLAFSPDGKLLLSGSHDGFVRVWDVEQEKERKNFPLPQPLAVAFSPDGRRAMAATADSSVKVWKTEGWEEERLLRIAGSGLCSAGFFRDGRRIWVASESMIAVGNVEQGERESMVVAAGSTGLTRLTPDGRYAISPGSTGMIRLWDLARRGAEVAKLAHHTAPVVGLAVHPTGRMFATIGQDRHVKVWGYVPGGMARVRGKAFCGIRVQQNAQGDVAIADVIAGTGAHKAGLQAGDVLKKVGGAAIANPTESVDLISSFFEGEEVEFEVERGGETKVFRIKLGKRPADLDR